MAMRRASVSALVIAVGTLSVPNASPAAPPSRGLKTDVSVDALSQRGDSIAVVSAEHPVTRVRVRWSRGVTARVPRSSSSRPFADLWLYEGDAPLPRARLSVPAGRASGRIALRVAGPVELKATLRVGSRPFLVLDDLPEGTSSLELVTVRSGRDLIRNTSACVRHHREWKGSLAISFADVATRFKNVGVRFVCD